MQIQPMLYVLCSIVVVMKDCQAVVHYILPFIASSMHSGCIMSAGDLGGMADAKKCKQDAS